MANELYLSLFCLDLRIKKSLINVLSLLVFPYLAASLCNVPKTFSSARQNSTDKKKGVGTAHTLISRHSF